MHIYMYVYYIWASLVAQWSRICQQCRWPGLDPWVRKSPWRREWQPTPVLLPGKSPWMEEVDGLYSPWGHKQSDMTLCVCMYVCVRERERAQNSGNKHCLQVQSLWKTVWETHKKKKKNRTTIWSTNSTSGSISKGNENTNSKIYLHSHVYLYLQ